MTTDQWGQEEPAPVPTKLTSPWPGLVRLTSSRGTRHPLCGLGSQSPGWTHVRRLLTERVDVGEAVLRVRHGRYFPDLEAADMPAALEYAAAAVQERHLPLASGQ